MKKGLKKALVTLVSVAMVFTMMAMPVYADDTAVVQDEETAVLAEATESYDAVEAAAETIVEEPVTEEEPASEQAPEAPAEEAVNVPAAGEGAEVPVENAESQEESVPAEPAGTETTVEEPVEIVDAGSEKAVDNLTAAITKLAADNMLKTEDEPAEEPVEELAYDGDVVKICENGVETEYRMLARQEGSTEAIKDGKVVIHLVPKNATVYTNLHYGSLKDTEMTKDVTINGEAFDITLPLDKCGKGIPVVPVKDSGETGSKQCYLCIPPQDKIPVAEEPVEELAYDGDVVKICENGVETEYRMLARQEGSTEAIKDGKVVIHLVPKNATVYTNLHYGSLKDTEMTKDVTINGEAFDITLPLDKCGKGIPVVPVKDSGETGSKQCYLCIPPQDKIPVAEEPVEELAYDGDVVKICENGVETEYRMLARQEGSTEAIKDGKVVIHLVPKNATVYTNLHYGSLKDTEMTKDVTINGEAFDITLPLDKCGKGIPVVPVKDSGETGSKQCYLCIPPQDKIPVAEEPVEELAYDGDVVKICENGVETEYRMLARQEGSTEAIKDGKVVIHLVPKNATVYTNLHYGSLKDTEMTKDVTINGEAFDITLPLDKCGKGIPVVPVKDSGETGSKQCYLCIPPQDKIPVAEEETAEKTDLTITNVQPMFKAVSAYLTKEGGREYLVMAMSAKGYHEMYKGTKEQAIANGDGTKDKGNDTWIHGYTNSDGKWEFKIPLKYGESYVALVSVSNDKYNDYKNGTGKFEDCLYARQLKIDRTAKTLVTDNYKQSDNPSAQDPDDPDTEKPDPVKPDDPSKPDESGSGDSGYAPAVDTSTTLADGEYTPDSFSWSGGTGKLTISCTKITVKNGQAYATIVFSSEKVDQLKASGSLYYKEGGGPSTFTIPVNLNANNTVIARTTAMSQPHWVEYTLYIGLAENEEQAEKAKQAKKDAAEARMKISEEAPAIVGLEAKDTESTVEYSKYFKIFEYEHGVKMLSIDISEKTALDEEYSENAKKALATGNSEEQVQYDDNGKAISKSKEEYITELYKNKVVNYLLVPEDFEVPAGLDKEYIIVTVPSEKTLMASDEVIAMMEELGCLDAISLLAMDEKDVKNDTLKKALKDEKIKLAGTLEKPEYAKVVKDKSDLAVLPGDVLPEEINKNAKDKEKLEKEAKEKQEALEEMESRFAALEVPVIIDRSAAEEEELAQAEWIKVYGVLFGCEEEADKIFEKKVKEAEKNGKN